MKVTQKKEWIFNVKYIEVSLPVEYGDEDMPYDFPLRTGNKWKATIEADTGRVLGWPTGQTGEFYLQVRDEGTYKLIDENELIIATIEEDDYVPHGIVPGEFGDYVELKINENGVVTNWPTEPSGTDFPGCGDEEDEDED